MECCPPTTSKKHRDDSIEFRVLYQICVLLQKVHVTDSVYRAVRRRYGRYGHGRHPVLMVTHTEIATPYHFGDSGYFDPLLVTV